MIMASEKSFSRVTRIDAGPRKLLEVQTKIKKRSSLKIGPIFCPKLGEEQKKVFTQNWSYFCPKLGADQKKGLHPKLVPFFCQYQERKKDKGKKISPKTRQPQLFRAPPRPGPGYDVPLEPPSRRP